MNFRQLRILRATVRNNFNLTEVASALFTAQSGVSKRLFAANTTRIALRRGHHLRDYAVRFVTCCAPALTPAQVHQGVFSKTGTE